MTEGPIIAIDFDGTIVDHRFPEIGQPVPGALDAIRALQRMGWRVILWTMRSGKHLDDAVAFLKRHGIEPWGVNANPTQTSWTTSPKAYAHHYVDDAALGCPLSRQLGFARMSVDWTAVLGMLLIREYGGDPRPKPETSHADNRTTHDGRTPGRVDPDDTVPNPAVRRGVGRPVLPTRTGRAPGKRKRQ